MDDKRLQGIEEMIEELRAAPQIYSPSAFWEHYTELNLRQLDEAGFDEFKRTVNRNYFQWVVVYARDPQFRAVLRRWLKHPTLRPLGVTLDEQFEIPQGRFGALRSWFHGHTHAAYLALLWEYVNDRDRNGVLATLDEPALGHPLTMSYRGRRMSEDLCNSVLEYLTIVEALPNGMPRDGTVIELGGGYGRLAWVFLSVLPSVRYVLVDIPPALAIAQRYLTELFPERQVFQFRRFSRAEEVAAELERADIVFLTPNQLELLAPIEADLFVNVSSLHEMRPDQIAHYFAMIKRHTNGCFYTKQWIRSVNRYDGLEVNRDDYPVPSNWLARFDREHPIQSHFFEALYELGHGVTDRSGTPELDATGAR